MNDLSKIKSLLDLAEKDYDTFTECVERTNIKVGGKIHEVMHVPHEDIKYENNELSLVDDFIGEIIIIGTDFLKLNAPEFALARETERKDPNVNTVSYELGSGRTVLIKEFKRGSIVVSFVTYVTDIEKGDDYRATVIYHEDLMFDPAVRDENYALVPRVFYPIEYIDKPLGYEFSGAGQRNMVAMPDMLNVYDIDSFEKFMSVSFMLHTGHEFQYGNYDEFIGSALGVDHTVLDTTTDKLFNDILLLQSKSVGTAGNRAIGNSILQSKFGVAYGLILGIALSKGYIKKEDEHYTTTNWGFHVLDIASVIRPAYYK